MFLVAEKTVTAIPIRLLEVLEHLQASGATVLRTDRHGAVTVSIRPESIRTETMLH